MSPSKYLFFLTGSIAACKAVTVISRLRQEGNEVRCVMSEGAQKFIGPATLEGITGHRVYTSLWQSGEAMAHIHLSRWADVGVICPASAHTIARFALGLADDLVTSTLLAWPQNKPLHLFPAMNSNMLEASPTQAHLMTLAQRGVRVARTESGELACGEEGEGRLLPPEQILAILREAKAKKGCVLVTGGPTREAVDGIRFISNVSSGRTAAELSDFLQQHGWQVDHLAGETAVQPQYVGSVTVFKDYLDLRQKCQEHLGRQDYQFVIHAAAVSDFTPVEVAGQPITPERKMPSANLQELVVRFTKNKKLLPQLKEFSRNKNISVIGFKLLQNSTGEDLEAAATGLLADSIDAIVANDWSLIDPQQNIHPGVIYWRQGQSQKFGNVQELASRLHQFMSLRQEEDVE